MLIIGLNSGTSADAIDAALCDISGAPPALQARIVKAITVKFPPGMQPRILAACSPQESHVDELCRLNAELGELFAKAALDVITKAGVTPGQVDLIGSHGQTVWHNVEGSGKVSATLQISEASIIAERTGITTIANFRPRDVAAGGQGAPLTGYVDWLLLRHPEHWRAVQNIGGIANVTFLPPLKDETSPPLAFDTGPGNVLIDGALSVITNGRRTYDQDGVLAKVGKVDEKFVKGRLIHPYFQRRPPKTTGREIFGMQMATSLVKLAQRENMRLDDIIASMTAITARSIADAYKRFAPAPVAEVILGGGGRRNRTLVAMLRDLLAPAKVMTHEEVGLDSDNKEALAFALLAHETWHHRPGTHPKITGAAHPVVLGQITPGANYVDLIRRTWTHNSG